MRGGIAVPVLIHVRLCPEIVNAPHKFGSVGEEAVPREESVEELLVAVFTDNPSQQAIVCTTEDDLLDVSDVKR